MLICGLFYNQTLSVAKMAVLPVLSIPASSNHAVYYTDKYQARANIYIRPYNLGNVFVPDGFSESRVVAFFPHAITGTLPRISQVANEI